MQIVKTTTGIVKEFQDIQAIKVMENPFKKGAFSCQVKQTVVTTYPSRKVSDDGLFSADELGVEPGKSYTSVRTALIPCPKDMQVNAIQLRLDAVKDKAIIYKLISANVKDVLTADQVYAIDNGVQTKAFYEDKFLIRTSDGNVPQRNGVDVIEYQQHLYSNSAKPDQDFRSVVSESDFELEDQQPATKLTNLSGLVGNGQAKF